MLEEETGSPGAQRVEDVLVDIEGGEHHYPGRTRSERSDPPGGLDAIQPGHPHVHQHHVRAGPGDLADRG